MWRYTCPKTPNVVSEFHSLASLNAVLEFHKSGCIDPESPWYYVYLPCSEEHEILDNGVPCDFPDCSIPYVRNDGLTGVD
jgi:hypothetical protein